MNISQNANEGNKKLGTHFGKVWGGGEKEHALPGKPP